MCVVPLDNVLEQEPPSLTALGYVTIPSRPHLWPVRHPLSPWPSMMSFRSALRQPLPYVGQQPLNFCNYAARIASVMHSSSDTSKVVFGFTGALQCGREHWRQRWQSVSCEIAGRFYTLGQFGVWIDRNDRLA